MNSNGSKFSRRTVLKTGASLVAAGLAAPAIFRGKALAAGQIVVASDGGAITDAVRVAFSEPFQKDTGVTVVDATHDPDSSTQIKVMVDTGNPVWDVSTISISQLGGLGDPSQYLEELQLPASIVDELIPGAATPYWAGTAVFASMMAFRRDTMSTAPTGWQDYWNVEKFPGKRGLCRYIDGTLEQALMGDGVPANEVYPLTEEKVERGFKALERIKPHVSVFWSSGAQLTQILQNGEIDLTGIWVTRAYAAIDAGAPIEIVWNQGLYEIGGWCIPKGTPNVALARDYIRSTLDAKRQAVYSNSTLDGPVNKGALGLMDPKRAALMPTWPDNFKQLTKFDNEFWSRNKAALSERYEALILS